MKFDSSRSLAIKNPELTEEWHSAKNGSLTPFDISFGSQKKVWWICKANPSHVWAAQIEARNNGSKCPYCLRKKASIEYCLASENPELAGEWHPIKNEGLTPYDVLPYSNKRVWWKCKACGNDWIDGINRRNYGNICPECSKRKKRARFLLAEKTLKEVNPEFAKEWHPFKNNGLTPDEISCASSKKVWWRCSKCGYEYEAKIKERQLHKSKCPGCKNTLITMDKSLEGVNLGLASQWHPVLNGSLRPEYVSPDSLMEAYWLCEKCGFEWKAAIGHRSINSECPNCRERKVLNAENSLAAIHPELIDQWDRERNGGLTPYDVFPENLRIAYWQCSKGHKYQRRISDKSNGMACPVCSRGQNAKFPRRALYYYLKEAFRDAKPRYLYAAIDRRYKLDVFIPSLNLGIEYDGYFGHTRSKSVLFDEGKNEALKDKIQLIRIREEGLPQINTFGSRVIVRRDATENASLLKCLISIGEYIKFHHNPSKEQLKVINSWSSADIDRDEGVIGSYKKRQKTVKKSMAELRPDLLEEWDYTKNGDLSPYSLPYGTSKKVWWICKTCQNSWEAQVRHRVKRFLDGKVIYGTGCPKCALKKIGENSRKTRHGRNRSSENIEDICGMKVQAVK